MNPPILKYPRTQHIEGSRFQPGDEDLAGVPLSALAGKLLVIEEKLDGANAGLSFTPGGELRLQSRGHYLTGGYRERHFALFKTWANAHRDALWRAIGDRYIVYGEWLYAKHTIYYDELPHYFLEFDIYDRANEAFLSTERRCELLRPAPVCSVPVLWRGVAAEPSASGLGALIGRSRYKSASWRDALADTARQKGLASERVAFETDPADEMEGLYIKVEAGDEVVGRYKFVRASFLTAVVDSGSHWLSRPIVPNRLKEGADIFAGAAAPEETR